ncbi:hypothetical protein EEE70_12270 [Neisseria gonorrhoeae]|nr:hypothetical protein EGP27_12390 [Neisseria gonorrhoeae]ROU46291.1 hypothetical protein EGO70_02395 [Neisseria gonorrhoeae]
MGRSYPYDCRMAGYLYPTKIFDASIVSEMPLLKNVGFENPTYGCYQPSFSASFSQVSKFSKVS